MLDCILLRVAFNSLKQESCNLFFDQLVLEVLVKA